MKMMKGDCFPTKNNPKIHDKMLQNSARRRAIVLSFRFALRLAPQALL
jgi:hypothetical protein